MQENLPSKTEMAGNLAKTAKDAFKLWLKEGTLFANDSTAKARISVCLECEFLNQDNRCTVCGCHMETKVKLQAAHCPKAKW